MDRPLNIVSVARSLPMPDDPSNGVFILNRLAAMHARMPLRVIQPVPYFPWLKPLPRWARAALRELPRLPTHPAPMAYIPGIFKAADALWLARAVRPIIGRMQREAPIDLLDAHFGYPEGAGCLRVARRLNIPLFITIRGFENEYVSKPGIGPQLIEAMRAATGCISVSHSLRELAVRHGADPQRVRVVHNAIDAGLFKRGDKSAARRALGLAAEQPLVVSVGHLIPRKRHHVLIEAFARVRSANPQARLAIIGARPFGDRYPENLLAQVRELNLQDAVRFVGNLPPHEVVGWLQAADAFALGTAREGCCNSVLEALSTGLPTVTTPAGDNAHFVADGRNGFIVPIDDAAAFARALEVTLRRGDWDYDAISNRLQSQVGSWDQVAERVFSFMRERLDAVTQNAVRLAGAPVMDNGAARG